MLSDAQIPMYACSLIYDNIRCFGLDELVSKKNLAQLCDYSDNSKTAV